MHFPSHLCTAGSNGSACVLPSRAKPVPWLRSVLAVHSRLLSPPALPGAEQDPELGLGIYSQARDRSISTRHRWQRAHLSPSAAVPLFSLAEGAVRGRCHAPNAASAGELQRLLTATRHFLPFFSGIAPSRWVFQISGCNNSEFTAVFFQFYGLFFHTACVFCQNV